MITWKGIFPAITTKFTHNDTLDFEMFEKNLDAQLAAGIHGIIIGGTLGEASTLTSKEKSELLKFTIDKVEGRIPVVLNIAESATRDALRIVEENQNSGIEGFMLLPPMRYRADSRETVTFFSTIAKATDLQIMIYNNPVDYQIEVTLDMFDQLSEIKNIDAVKESTRDVANVTRMINRFGDRFSVMSGVDPIAFESMVSGASGWVAGLVCAFPAETVAIYNLVKAGRIDKALELNRWFNPLLELDLNKKLVQYIKLAEAKVGIGSEYVRAPRLALEGEERANVLRVITEVLKTRPAVSAYLDQKKKSTILTGS